MNRTIQMGLALSVFAAGAAFATDGAGTVQRDVNQQQRIEQGLKSGELNTREAARLERQEAVVDHMQAHAMKDGNVSAAEHARLVAAQNRVSKNIYQQKHDAQEGNSVQRNVNQETRIEQGINSGSLSSKEAAQLERGQARSDRQLARAGADGHVGRVEQGHIRRGDNRQSRQIFRKKHN
jgi:hypothetical protein